MQARVAIVLRTKDRPVFVARALRSITAQSYRRWELVIVNDGGDADTLSAVVREAGLGDDPRARTISSPASLGRWPSANLGIANTEAPLLVLHDDDDSWHPQFLERTVAYLDAHPEAPGVVSRIEIVWETMVEGEPVEQDREVFQGHLVAPLLGDTLLFNRFVPIAFLYRRTVHDEVGLYRDDLRVVGDWNFNLSVLTRWRLEYLGETPLAYWHQRRSADGVDGNSVVAERSDHGKYDALVRDDALRERISANGIGELLYLTKFIDQRFNDVEAGLRAAIEDVRYEASSPVRRTLRRWYAALRRATGRDRRG